LNGMTQEEIKSALADQSVSKFYRLTGKRNEELFALVTFLFTSEIPTMSSSIYGEYEKVPVRVYIPKPTRCFRCQRFGRTLQRFASSLVWGACGETGHGQVPCS
jgi:hypothetical protein